MTPRLKLAAANGWTRALLSAALMQAAAGVPSAGPLTFTPLTSPLEPKTMVALDA